ncbi:MAG TPA: right-handed parallel beta-helix repeat-containing protein, partial [Hymenobacter sp.]|nr:right-handed parallel beta-helix repeat-containing protein [Hymenobacter sp.]
MSAIVQLSGTVFEDVSYGGGAGRSRASSGGVPRSGARVELYDNSGAFVSSTTTSATGLYEFSAPAGTYTVRVVNRTVSSSRTSFVTNSLPVQTFVNGDVNRVGGEAPEKVDAPANTSSQPLASLTTATTVAQSVAQLTLGGSGASGVDFGFNFDIITNTNNAGQGSFRQFIMNSNTLPNATLDQIPSNNNGTPVGPNPAIGVETSIFMIPSGNAVPGLRAGLISGLTNGVAVIQLLTSLPFISDPGTSIDGTTQTINVGNTNSVMLGAGGVVGVNNTTLARLDGPEVQIMPGPGNFSRYGLDLDDNRITVKGVAIYGFGSSSPTSGVFGNVDGANIHIGNAANNGTTLTGNVIGASATSFTQPTTGRSYGNGILTEGGFATALITASITNNLIGFNSTGGIDNRGTVSGTGYIIDSNEIRGNGIDNAAADGVLFSETGGIVRNNLITANQGPGIDTQNSAGGATITNNTITNNGLATGQTPGIRIHGAGNTISRNVIANNYGAGIMGVSSLSNTSISQNSIYGNGTILSGMGAAATGQIGIDLLSSTDNSSTGTPPYVTLNDDGDGDGVLNMPVLQAATLNGGNLTLTGFATPGAQLEFFMAQSNNLAAGNNFGQGGTYLLALSEGSSQDLDASTGSYGQGGALVNGFRQGTETNQSRFRFVLPLSSLSAAQQTNLLVFGGRITVTGT